jgi:hypothetical protein
MNLGLGRARFAVVLLTTFACACMMPEPVLRMTPLSDHILWVQGSPAVVEEGKVARAGVAFIRQEQETVGFHVEIENTSMAPVLVDPSKFYVALCTRAADGKSRACEPSQWAVDPEKVLLALDVAHSRNVAGQANKEALASTFILLDMAAALTGASQKNPALAGVALAHSAHMGDVLASSEAEGAQRAVSYENERARWETVALRKTTLLPGSRVSGMVYVARSLAANEVRVHLRVGSEIMVFPFKQVLIDARSPRR